MAYKIHAKIGARYNITANVNVDDGITNGASGYLRDVSWGIQKNGDKVILRVFVEFKNPKIGKKTRKERENLLRYNNINHNWTPIEYVTRMITMRQNSLYRILRKQIPIEPAEAVTVHKTQGQTYDNIVIHTMNKRLNARLLYVAFSRVISLDGLFIEGTYDKPNPRVTDIAQSEIEKMKKERPLKFQLKFPIE